MNKNKEKEEFGTDIIRKQTAAIRRALKSAKLSKAMQVDIFGRLRKVTSACRKADKELAWGIEYTEIDRDAWKKLAIQMQDQLTTDPYKVIHKTTEDLFEAAKAEAVNIAKGREFEGDEQK